MKRKSEMKDFINDCMLFKSKVPLHKALGFISWASLILFSIKIYDIFKTIAKI
jgi:hypothetical protein